VNKTDDRKAQAPLVEFYALGFDPVIPIASEHGTGVGDLLDAVTSRLAVGKSRRPPSRRDRRSRSSPSQRRQVVARQPAAQGRAHGGERDGRARRAIRSTRS
jgi:GTP-binding protein